MKVDLLKSPLDMTIPNAQEVLSNVEWINRDRLGLYSQILLYGDIIPLKFKIDLRNLSEELLAFSNSWVNYQPSKPDTHRKGLSITSLDGGMSGYPDLYSLREYMREGGSVVSENQFNVLTRAALELTSISELLNHYAPSLGRSRFVKFDRGGHFPPHRDQSFSYQVPDYFRIFVPLLNCTPNTLFFIVEDKVIQYEPGRAYFFNAMKVHTVFSTVPEAVTLALSVPLTQENVAKTLRAFEVN